MSMELVKALVCLVCAAGIMRAYRRGEHHIATRLAAAISLVMAADVVRMAYRGRTSAVAASALAAFVVTILFFAVVKGRFHAPR
jgi:hypothetical protein